MRYRNPSVRRLTRTYPGTMGRSDAVGCDDRAGMANRITNCVMAWNTMRLQHAVDREQLTAAPARLAFLAECARAFFQILGADHPLHGVQRIVQFEGFVFGDHLGMPQQLFDCREQ
jgi:hypothetical protein